MYSGYVCEWACSEGPLSREDARHLGGYTLLERMPGILSTLLLERMPGILAATLLERMPGILAACYTVYTVLYDKQHLLKKKNIQHRPEFMSAR